MTLRMMMACDLRCTKDGGVGRESMPRYAAVLRALHDQKLTYLQVAELFDMDLNMTRKLLNTMRHLGLLRICGWKPQRRQIHTPVWSSTPGDDVPRPLCANGKPSSRQEVTKPALRLGVDLVAFANLVKAMDEQPRTIVELAAASGLYRITAWRVVKHMHDLGLVHVADWALRARGGVLGPMWTTGIDKPDVKRPANRGQEEYHRHRRELRALRTKAPEQRAFQALVATVSANSSLFPLAA